MWSASSSALSNAAVDAPRDARALHVLAARLMASDQAAAAAGMSAAKLMALGSSAKAKRWLKCEAVAKPMGRSLSPEVKYINIKMRRLSLKTNKNQRTNNKKVS